LAKNASFFKQNMQHRQPAVRQLLVGVLGRDLALPVSTLASLCSSMPHPEDKEVKKTDDADADGRRSRRR
jgi:hypothetical protein